MNKIIKLIFLFLIFGCSNSLRKMHARDYTVIGQIFIHYSGGELPLNNVDYIIKVGNLNCLRFYPDQFFTQESYYNEISTNDSGFYKVNTRDSSIAIVLKSCGNQLQIIDTLRNIEYDKIHLISFNKELSDTIIIVDTLFYKFPS